MFLVVSLTWRIKILTFMCGLTFIMLLQLLNLLHLIKRVHRIVCVLSDYLDIHGLPSLAEDAMRLKALIVWHHTRLCQPSIGRLNLLMLLGQIILCQGWFPKEFVWTLLLLMVVLLSHPKVIQAVMRDYINGCILRGMIVFNLSWLRLTLIILCGSTSLEEQLLKVSKWRAYSAADTR